MCVPLTKTKTTGHFDNFSGVEVKIASFLEEGSAST